MNRSSVRGKGRGVRSVVIFLPVHLLVLLSVPSYAAKIGLDPIMGDGAAGRTMAISGVNFDAGVTYTILVGGYPVGPATVASDGSGVIPATALRLPALPRGNLDVTLSGASFTRTFTGAYRVWPNICLSPAQGDGRAGQDWQYNAAIPVGGWAGMVFLIQGTGFAANATINANSITVGGVTTTHPAITITADGSMPSSTVMVNSTMADGAKDIVIDDGATNIFPGTYAVHPTIGLSPARGAAATGTQVTITGWGFADGVIPASPANNVTIGGLILTRPAVTITDGYFTVTGTIPAPGLANNTSNPVVINDGTANNFPVAYHSYTNPGQVVAVWPVRLTGIPLEALQVQGISGLTGSIVADSMRINETNNQRSVVTNPTIAVAGGAFPQTWVVVNGAVPYGVNRLRFTNPQAFNVQSLRTVPALTVCPVLGDGAAGWTTSLTGWGFNQGNVNADTITVGGTATTHVLDTVGNNGIMGMIPVTVNAPLPNGPRNVRVNNPGVGNITWTGAVVERRCIGLSFITGPGTAGERVLISGTGFTASSTIPQNTITFGGTAAAHRDVYIGANGTFSATVMDLPALGGGTYDVVTQDPVSETFPSAYRVIDPFVAVSKYRNPVRGTVGDIVTFSFSFTNTDFPRVGDPPAVGFVLWDTLPPLTQYVGASSTCYPEAKAEWFDGVWNPVEPGIPANVKALRWTLLNKLPPAASGWARFQVQVQ